MHLEKFLISVAFLAVFDIATADYHPVGDKIMTTWGENIDPANVWNVYPRPIMERADWENLNGLWEYAIIPADAVAPNDYQGEILVPFCVESALSGVGKEVGADNALWYRRSFDVPKNWKGKDVLLNFGAVDWQADVWVNGIKVGSHTGGYAPFSFNITPALTPKGNNELVVRVWDPTDLGTQPRGKQVANPVGIWYTPVTGIWQTVWLEPVSSTHITALKTVPDIDKNILTIEVNSSGIGPDLAEVLVRDAGRTIATGKAFAGEEVTVRMPEGAELWSPANPKLYDLEIRLVKDGKVVDKVKSYAAMRKVSVGRKDGDVARIQLNDKDLFQYGPLDQGWWPDGLYTAPSYEAMIYDVDKTKQLGFNMIRKHVKIEPAAWYTYCDRNGILVWQDMPSGDKDPQWQPNGYFDAEEFVRSPESEATYRKEWKEIMDCLYSYPSIVVWTPFNECWGQFKTKEIVEWTKAYDQSRLVNPASGGNFYPCGDILDIHHYPQPPESYVYDGRRVNVLGEYGGIGLYLDAHAWNPNSQWSYSSYSSPKEVTDKFEEYAKILDRKAADWFAGAVYTQTTDVESECNGLMTYDRKVVKVEEDRLHKIVKELIDRHSDK